MKALLGLKHAVLHLHWELNGTTVDTLIIRFSCMRVVAVAVNEPSQALSM